MLSPFAIRPGHAPITPDIGVHPARHLACSRAVTRRPATATKTDALRPRDAGIQDDLPVDLALHAFDDDVSRPFMRERDQPAELVTPDRVALDHRQDRPVELHDVRIADHQVVQCAEADPEIVDRDAAPGLPEAVRTIARDGFSGPVSVISTTSRAATDGSRSSRLKMASHASSTTALAAATLQP